MNINNLYTPAVSYWSESGQAVYTPTDSELFRAFVQSDVLLLIHGYNNTLQEGSDSYNNFVEHLKIVGTISASIVGIYWPGANWEGGLYYMQALGQVPKVAQVLSDGLYRIAKAKGYLKVNIVTHSLGGRLALETVKQLIALKQNDDAPAALEIGKITMMAAAVPTKYIENSGELYPALSSFKATQSIFSLNDKVLHWAFPIGQTLGGQGFFPIALGRKYWSDGSQLMPQMNQVDNDEANHGDYWGVQHKSFPSEAKAAKTVYNFHNIGPNIERNVAARLLPLNMPTPERELITPRTLQARASGPNPR